MNCYFVELTTDYSCFHLGRLYPIENGRLVASDGDEWRLEHAHGGHHLTIVVTI